MQRRIKTAVIYKEVKDFIAEHFYTMFPVESVRHFIILQIFSRHTMNVMKLFMIRRMQTNQKAQHWCCSMTIPC